MSNTYQQPSREFWGRGYAVEGIPFRLPMAMREGGEHASPTSNAREKALQSRA